MMHNKILRIAVLMMVMAACSHKPAQVSNESRNEPTPKTQATMGAKQLASEQEAQYVTEVSFKKGSSELTPSAQKKIEKLLSSISDKRHIEEIKVVSWGDEAYPTKDEKKLPRAQQELAKERNQQIQSFLKIRDKTVPVEMHSMAERPSALSNLWGGSDARIKKSLESNGLTKAGTKEKASHAIIMVMMK